MAEISYYDADLADAVDKLNDTMGKLAKAPPGVRPEMLAMADKKLREAVELRKGFQLALRQAPREQARGFRERFEELSARVDELAGEVRWAKAEHERNGLFGARGPGGGGPGGGGPNGGGPPGNTELLGRTAEVQRKTEQSLLSTARMVEQSKEVAAATGEQLREQRQQIVQITDEVMRMEDSLTRADKLLRTFARRMATDRVVLLATLLVFLGITAIVIYKAMHPNDDTFYVPDEVTPPNPATLYNATVNAVSRALRADMALAGAAHDASALVLVQPPPPPPLLQSSAVAATAP